MKAIDVLVSQNQSFDSKMCGDLYDKYIGAAQREPGGAMSSMIERADAAR